MRSRYLSCGGLEVHFSDWGAEHGEAVVLWHGLARTGRDFDPLAGHLAERYRVICPDTPGRGLSQWARDPSAQYNFAFYAQVAVELLDRLGLEHVRWVGTSMGGALGIILASGALKGRLTHLFLNDIGCELPQAAIDRILAYAGSPPTVDTVTELEALLREIYVPFGAMSDAEWRHMAETSARRTDAGRITVHYDPRMVTQLADHPDDFTTWQAYDRVTANTFLLRGKTSDVLLSETAGAMTGRGPRCELVELDGYGHAPPLNTPEQFDLVSDFLGR